jgi:hypothetical protein
VVDVLVKLDSGPATMIVILICLAAILLLCRQPKEAQKVDHFDIAIKRLQERNPRHRDEIEQKAKEADERFAAQTKQLLEKVR